MEQSDNGIGKNYAYEIVGGKPLKGDIEISGSKNAARVMMMPQKVTVPELLSGISTLFSVECFFMLCVF